MDIIREVRLTAPGDDTNKLNPEWQASLDEWEAQEADAPQIPKELYGRLMSKHYAECVSLKGSFAQHIPDYTNSASGPAPMVGRDGNAVSMYAHAILPSNKCDSGSIERAYQRRGGGWCRILIHLNGSRILIHLNAPAAHLIAG